MAEYPQRLGNAEEGEQVDRVSQVHEDGNGLGGAEDVRKGSHEHERSRETGQEPVERTGCLAHVNLERPQ